MTRGGRIGIGGGGEVAGLRQTLGVRAAVAVARRLGVGVSEPLVLHSSNNVIAWLSPSRVLAKIGIGHYGRAAEEIATGEYLARVGAPVVGPAPEVPPGVYIEDGYPMTFRRYEPSRGDQASSAAAARALHALHAARRVLGPGSCRAACRA